MKIETKYEVGDTVYFISLDIEDKYETNVAYYLMQEMKVAKGIIVDYEVSKERTAYTVRYGHDNLTLIDEYMLSKSHECALTDFVDTITARILGS